MRRFALAKGFAVGDGSSRFIEMWHDTRTDLASSFFRWIVSNRCCYEWCWCVARDTEDPLGMPRLESADNSSSVHTQRELSIAESLLVTRQ